MPPRKGWAAVYCRLSKEDEEKTARESESIRNQRALLLAWAADHGYRIYRVYTDEDYSGIDRAGLASTRCWPTHGLANLRSFWQKRSRGSPVTWSW